MPQRRYHIYDVFTDRALAGNPLAVVHDGEGLSSAAIARRLSLSDGTVRNYLSDAILKTGATNRTEAARIARDKGWL